VRSAPLILVLVAPLVCAGFVLGSARDPQEVPHAVDGTTPAPPPHPLDDTARLRNIARMMVNVEERHRAQVAELERIARVADDARIDDVYRSAVRTRHEEQAAYDARMTGFARDLGAELFARLRTAMDNGAGTPPPLRPIPPEPPSPPPPLPHEEEAQNAEKRARTEEDGGG